LTAVESRPLERDGDFATTLRPSPALAMPIPADETRRPGIGHGVGISHFDSEIRETPLDVISPMAAHGAH
jgi:hypothetical protein